MGSFKPRYLVVLLCGLTGLGSAAPTALGAPADGYVVELSASPLSSYTGGTRGIPATSPRRTGASLRVESRAARRYRAYLARTQRAALARVPGAAPQVIHSYRTSFAGFSARLTPGQVAALRSAPQVARIWRDELRRPTQAPPGTAEQEALGGATGGGASYLGLPTGLWQRLGGVDQAGEGVIVGVIDTGIVPEHPSFADDPSAGYQGRAYDPPEVWNGVCQGGERFTTTACNDKLIGARYFVEGFGEDNLAEGSFVSPRDDDGHGSHTASTAAGNYGVNPVIDGNELGVGLISGIAPRAYVAAYKGCWAGQEGDGCAVSDLVAAIDAAVADGVDVINYSIGSDTSNVIGPDSIAFLGASDAGVFVATSAGNAGPGESTVGSPASVPWLTTVAASTTRQTFEATLTVLGSGTTLTVRGASVGRGLPTTRIVDGAESGLPDVAPADAAGCLPGTLDPAKVRGAIVLCLGNRMRAVRGRAVEEAGGVGIVLYNPEGADTLLIDSYRIPGIHISHEDGLRVKALIAGGARARMSPGRATALPRGAILADFSARGPQEAVADIGKPDVTAPGVAILAAAAPELPTDSPFQPGQLFQAISGTSMSSPHVAGAGALLKQLHPLFTPAEIKSSLMTTADPDVLREDGTTPATPFDTGSGEIDPNRAADPGLVLDAGTLDYLSYLEAVDPAILDGDLPTIEPADLNLPSISIGALAGERTTTRTFRSVESRSRRWTVSPQVPRVMRVSVSPRRFTLRPGQEQEVAITIWPGDAALEEYAAGAIVLTSGERRVRVTIQARPTAVAAPENLEVTTGSSSGSEPLRVRTGFTGELRAVGWGLARPRTAAGETIGTTTGGPELGGDAGTKLYPVTVAAGAQLLAGRIANADDGDPGTDLDLYLFRDPNADGDLGDAELVDSAADAGSDETVTLPLPGAGSYVFAVVGFTTQDPATTYDFTSWLVADPRPDDPAPAPGLVVGGDPLAVTPGEEVELSLDWSGVQEPGSYFGVVTYHDAAAPVLDDARAFSVVELTRTGDDAG